MSRVAIGNAHVALDVRFFASLLWMEVGRWGWARDSEHGRQVWLAPCKWLSLCELYLWQPITDSNSDTGEEIKEAVRGMIEEMGRPNIADSFPFLKMIDPQGIRKRNNIYFRKMLDLFDTIINQRSKLGAKSASGKDTDILDILIDLTENAEDKRVHEQLQKSTIGHLLLDIFGAGTETTSATLEWSMAELLKAPEAMSKAQAELEQVIGKGKKMKESDIPQLPYLQAIIKETLRLHPPAPLLVPRLAESDVEVCGYTIPKDAQVLINVWAIGRDPNVWENPDKFMPERFLKSNIDAGGRDFELIPFGAGRRICPGMLLANRILHLTLGSLLNSFDWKLEDGVEPDTLNMEDKYGLTLIMDQPLRAFPTATST
ncbi:hypothetical protein TIFTF001_040857 [Ficus carica]|uniref:Cytochrome P450 n=1 Tax=Ficus carica TaxID=3494 RepID=A0AA88D4C6_FICCA|nr:hypothetical protein TIFTF001_040857 [Ficus carica]